MTITVDIVSDVICPWCYVGKRRLEAAIRESGRQVKVRWLPYQLNPAMPPEGMDRKAYRTRKFGTWERSLELDAELNEAARPDGLHFAFDKIARTPNTFDAHRVLWLADELGVQDGVMESLFRAYFVDGKNIGDRDTLLDAAAAGGLDRERAVAMLASDEGTAEVTAVEADARQIGVNGVPYFVVNSAVTISGAQPTAAFVAAFNQVSATEPAGGTCAVGSGTC